ncbi:hypothetical protein AB1Y20_020021 [Prymnesium parvum]|uniref:RRM domain-containing protein n=1 Tax=Prymnesium parvum TaxID=97485 RepID=A0AB34JTH8_PRYPA
MVTSALAATPAIGEVKLFVGGIPQHCGDYDLRQVFLPFGELSEVFFLPNNSRTGQRCAFVKMSDWARANLAIAALNGKCRMAVDMDPIVVRPKGIPPPHGGSASGGLIGIGVGATHGQSPATVDGLKLFVGSLPGYCDESMLLTIFAPFGEVSEIFFLPNNSKTGQRCAFVRYTALSSSLAAVQALNGKFRFTPEDERIVVRQSGHKPANERPQAQGPQNGMAPNPVANALSAEALMQQAQRVVMQNAIAQHTFAVQAAGLLASHRASMGSKGSGLDLQSIVAASGADACAGAATFGDSASGGFANTYLNGLGGGLGNGMGITLGNGGDGWGGEAARNASPSGMASLGLGAIGTLPPEQQVVLLQHMLMQQQISMGSNNILPPNGSLNSSFGVIGGGVPLRRGPNLNMSPIGHRPPGQATQEPKLFVGGMPAGTSEAVVRQLFAPFGELENVVMLPPKSTSGQQCSFVLFKSMASAISAQSILHMQHRMASTDDAIVVKFADSNSKRRQQTVGLTNTFFPTQQHNEQEVFEVSAIQ